MQEPTTTIRECISPSRQPTASRGSARDAQPPAPLLQSTRSLALRGPLPRSRVAQLVERSAVNRLVVGSSPTAGANCQQPSLRRPDIAYPYSKTPRNRTPNPPSPDISPTPGERPITPTSPPEHPDQAAPRAAWDHHRRRSPPDTPSRSSGQTPTTEQDA